MCKEIYINHHLVSSFISKLVLCIQVDLHWMACNGFVDYLKGKWVLSLVIFSIQCFLFFQWLNLRESLIQASSFKHWFLYVPTIMLGFWENNLIFFLYKYQNNKWAELWCKMEGCQYVRRLSCYKLSSLDVKKLIYWQVCYHTGAKHKVSTKCIHSKHVLAKTIIKVLPCTLGINLKPLWTPFL